MRVVRVWVTAAIIVFTVTLGWLASQPVIIGISRSLMPSMGAQGLYVATAVEYVSYGWGPTLIAFTLLWAMYSSQQRDVESELYAR